MSSAREGELKKEKKTPEYPGSLFSSVKKTGPYPLTSEDDNENIVVTFKRVLDDKEKNSLTEILAEEFKELSELPLLIVPPPPDDYPKECRFRGSFIPVENKKVQTDVASHTGYYATFNGKTYYVKLLKLDPTMPDSDKTIELEAAAWITYHNIEPSIVPAHTFPLYDYDEKTNTYTISAIASEIIPGFVPNRKEPFTTAELIIHALDNDFGYQRGNVLGLFDQLSKNLNRSCETNFEYLKEGYNYVTSIVSSFWKPKEAKPAASYLQTQLDYVLNKSKKEPLEQKEISSLVQLFENRLAHLPECKQRLNDRYQAKSIDEKNYKEELMRYNQEDLLLKETILSIKNFDTHLLNNKVDILKLELLDREIRKKNLDIENEQTYPDPNKKVPGHEITISDLRHYRLIKIQAMSLCLSYYCYENDNHNNNNGKKGRVDFDMSFWEFLKKFKNPNWFEWFKDTVKNVLPTFIKDIFGIKDKFTYTVEDMENFPHIKAPLRYWPAVASPLDASSKVGAAPFIENFYRVDDVVPFQRLKSHPVFDFIKWKEFLKCALVTDEMHEASAKIVIRNKVEFMDLEDNKKKVLLDEFVAHKKQQSDAFTDTLVQCPSFKLFLEQYTEKVNTANNGVVTKNKIFELIKQEFEEEQLAIYKNEVKNGNKHYQSLVNAIDFKKMEERFDKICNATFTVKHVFKP